MEGLPLTFSLLFLLILSTSFKNNKNELQHKNTDGLLYIRS